MDLVLVQSSSSHMPLRDPYKAVSANGPVLESGSLIFEFWVESFCSVNLSTAFSSYMLWLKESYNKLKLAPNMKTSLFKLI